ncbi:MAG: sigma-70 family RNA polymerase sigma factor, partial [Mycobacterium sp.]
MARPDTARTDAELLRAHAAGDPFAFEELIHRHRVRLHRVARRASSSAEDADDALQEALLSAHRGARSFRNDATVGSWLHRIVVNACRDRLRHNAIRPTTALDPALCL